jgi:deoxyhypusine monooxygenase
MDCEDQQAPDFSKLTQEDYDRLSQTLADQSLHMEKRLRSVFTLKAIANDQAVNAIKVGLTDPSVLLAHEVAYCLGQMQNHSAVPHLTQTLQNSELHPMVRHEAAEALGALGGEDARVVLKQFADSPIPEIRDTCVIALSLLDWKVSNPANANDNAFHPMFGSVDPAPPAKSKDIAKLKEKLCDTKRDIFSRYRAMFALRNIGTSDAVAALSAALNLPDEGAVFAHEVAYVLGQVSHKGAIEALSTALTNESLNCMVRHEAAEALGNIADESIVPVLEKFKEDKEQPVSESCVIALDILAYNNSDQFQYADGLTGGSA